MEGASGGWQIPPGDYGKSPGRRRLQSRVERVVVGSDEDALVAEAADGVPGLDLDEGGRPVS
jgi:hypothetical protein